MPAEARDEVTRILQEVGEHPDAAKRLMPLVYDQLRAIAQRRMVGERRDHTLQATALVHEAYVRLLGDREVAWASRGQFYVVAAEAMRRILIDHARKRGSKKRGGGKTAIPISLLDLAAEADVDQVVALDDALRQLQQEDERAATVVQLRFYAGLSVEDTAAAMGVSKRTVLREWSFARARLYQLLDAER